MQGDQTIAEARKGAVPGTVECHYTVHWTSNGIWRTSRVWAVDARDAVEIVWADSGQKPMLLGVYMGWPTNLADECDLEVEWNGE